MKLVEYQSVHYNDVMDYYLTDDMRYYTGTPQEKASHHSILAYPRPKII